MGPHPYRDGAPGQRLLPRWWRVAEAFLIVCPYVTPLALTAWLWADAILPPHSEHHAKLIRAAVLYLPTWLLAVPLVWGSERIRKRLPERLTRPLETRQGAER
jgi:hypothetical protein